MQVALDAGDTLVVPKAVLSGGPAGWWQINGTTGQMRAVLGEDLGGSAKFSGGYNPRNAPGGGSPTGNGTTWGNYGGKTRNPYSPGQAKPKGGGGEIGEYIATFIAFLESLPVIVKLGLLVVEVLSIVIAILNILS